MLLKKKTPFNWKTPKDQRLSLEFLLHFLKRLVEEDLVGFQNHKISTFLVK
jgi:hypothetical protein